MPRNAASLQITEAYRNRMLALRQRSEQAAETAWREVSLADLDSTYADWVATAAAAVSSSQREAARLSAAYLSAFVSSESGHRVRTPPVDSAPYVGLTRDGRPLSEAYDSFRVGVLAELKAGKDATQALEAGKVRAVRAVGVDTDHASRQSLSDAMAADPRIVGWRRAVKGTCDACLGLAEEALSPPGTPLEIHPGCQCCAEPSLKGIIDRFPRPSGTKIFAAMSAVEQDGLFGPEKAQLLRAGDIELSDCVDRSELATADDFITSRPLTKIPAAKAGDTDQ